MNDDEEHLVVMFRPGERLLEPEQVVDFEIRSVGKSHGSTLTGADEVLLESAMR
jgi:hypothetical protein